MIASSTLAVLLVASATAGAPKPAVQLSQVVKGEKAQALPAAARSALAQDLSVRLAGREKHFFALYDRNAYEGVPNFVSLDVALHLFHVRIDGLVAAAESSVALPALKVFAKSQASAAAKLPSPDERIARLVVYHALPYVLLGGTAQDLDLSKPIADRVQAAAQTLRQRTGALEVGLCQRPIDLSLFKPRGHYAGALQGYFLAFVFYSQCAFALDTAEGLSRAADVARLAGKDGLAGLEKVRALADLVAGPADDVDLSQFLPLVPEPAPPMPAALSKPALDGLASGVRRLPPGRVASQAGPDEPPRRVFRLLGGAAESDSLLFAGLAGASGKMPSVLHLLAQLGSADARALLGPDAPAALEPGRPGRTLFDRWLEVLRLAVARPGEGHPPFEQSEAWARHLTVAAAGSWAELRHDTLLYVKAPLLWAQGGHSDELPAQKAAGYVEPRPEVYRALSGLLAELARSLGPKEKGEVATLSDLLQFLTDVSELELSGKPFPPPVDERLRTIGTEMERITRGHADELSPQALVCDVIDYQPADGARQTLEVGIGDVDELYVIVPRGGKPLLTRGGAFSYYEFAREGRLDDAGFRSLLDQGKAPQPAWAAPSGKTPPGRPAPARRGD